MIKLRYIYCLELNFLFIRKSGWFLYLYYFIWQSKFDLYYSISMPVFCFPNWLLWIGRIRKDTQNLLFKVCPTWDAELWVSDAKDFGPVSPGPHRNKFVKKITATQKQQWERNSGGFMCLDLRTSSLPRWYRFYKYCSCGKLTCRKYLCWVFPWRIWFI